MQIRERARKMGVNLNTYVGIAVGVLSIASSVGMCIWVTANKSRDVEDLQNWRKDYIVQSEANAARFDQRLKTVEDKQAVGEGDVKALTYRMGTNEQNVGTVLASIKDLSSNVNELTGDVKVVREILQRQDRQSSTGR
ncbi:MULTISPECIES: hypothetical protein [unclassified Rhizobium]|uniref:hypothetical protein n=1 Tax=unclassified Rhizobium TaxID=2613769 RepID=UPI00161DD4FA|nr:MULTISPECIES: hypothetical protein [unclassified Rhizobium]MBB3385976.1 uncharacterized protein (UPF0335 family) [Rhizobium sp. BK098]MBB3617846.1 uncharacterized protein (UPF0335 family) [Rhizobium sp. BK609]MBB3683338.1 uncharacterized protein (UPF0335 family) [Rhizobium sp. BK612]